MTTNVSVENSTHVVAVSLSDGGSCNVSIEVPSIEVKASTQGIQGAPGESASTLEPRVASLEAQDAAIRGDYGDHDFDYSNYINTLLS